MRKISFFSFCVLAFFSFFNARAFGQETYTVRCYFFAGEMAIPANPVAHVLPYSLSVRLRYSIFEKRKISQPKIEVDLYRINVSGDLIDFDLKSADSFSNPKLEEVKRLLLPRFEVAEYGGNHVVSAGSRILKKDVALILEVMGASPQVYKHLKKSAYQISALGRVNSNQDPSNEIQEKPDLFFEEQPLTQIFSTCTLTKKR